MVLPPPTHSRKLYEPNPIRSGTMVRHAGTALLCLISVLSCLIADSRPDPFLRLPSDLTASRANGGDDGNYRHQVKARTASDNSGSLGSHVMQYGKLELNTVEDVYQYIGNPPNDISVPSRSMAWNQWDADLVYYWHEIKRSPEGSPKRHAAERELLDIMSHRLHIDNSIELVVKLLFGSEKGMEVLKAVRPAGQPVVDDWECLKSMVRSFEAQCGSLSEYGLKITGTLANICNQGIKKETMTVVAAQACPTFPSNPWSSLRRGFSA